jgi:hypothetical protein
VQLEKVEQVGICVASVEIPPQAIGRMGVGFYRPIEGHLVAEGEGLCSTHVEPSLSQYQQAPLHQEAIQQRW